MKTGLWRVRWSLVGMTALAVSTVAAFYAAVPTIAARAASFAATPIEGTAIQAGFSPEGTARSLVLDIINDARASVRVMAYTFTAPDIARALVAAKRRGVDVRVVVDAGESHGKAAVAAMNLLVNAGIPVRINDQYKILHDKVLIVDGKHVETGSFNFSAAAERTNSENAVVLWNRPDLAKQYSQHWESRWNSAQTFNSTY
ncbi:Plasmid conjugative transfer endonuclease (plasmid) [Burkholderia sp. KJ006]|uniref:phospholipase D family nuclease n=1 Tax=Burkholderia sp. KJ006 TaxID=416344 RepID=UPI00025F0E6E|nr:phospholipase D family protein [Burkholderia sp. KJ006]AFJ90393.1 Plasmid conjugative transfer endonuclease [Burkholderia sp. KJ006]